MADEPAFEELLRSSQRTALHLEMRDRYATSDPAYRAWQADPSIDPLAFYGFWPTLLDEVVARGVVVCRVRIVSEPISDYIRFEYDITEALNIAAGEDVRWLPRRRASDLCLPGNDFWLFDDRLVLLNHFSGEGESAGHEVSDNPGLVRRCLRSFAGAWERSIAHHAYRPD